MNTTIAQAQKQMIRNKARITDLLKITTEEYCGLQYKRGLEFLHLYMGDDSEAVNSLSGTELYWNWWRSTYNLRDSVFVDAYDGLEDFYGPQNMRVMYSYCHKPDMLVAELTIPAVVLGGQTFTHQLITSA